MKSPKNMGMIVTADPLLSVVQSMGWTEPEGTAVELRWFDNGAFEVSRGRRYASAAEYDLHAVLAINKREQVVLRRSDDDRELKLTPTEERVFAVLATPAPDHSKVWDRWRVFKKLQDEKRACSESVLYDRGDRCGTRKRIKAKLGWTFVTAGRMYVEDEHGRAVPIVDGRSDGAA